MTTPPSLASPQPRTLGAPSSGDSCPRPSPAPPPTSCEPRCLGQARAAQGRQDGAAVAAGLKAESPMQMRERTEPAGKTVTNAKPAARKAGQEAHGTTSPSSLSARQSTSGPPRSSRRRGQGRGGSGAGLRAPRRQGACDVLPVRRLASRSCRSRSPEL